MLATTGVAAAGVSPSEPGHARLLGLRLIGVVRGSSCWLCRRIGRSGGRHPARQPVDRRDQVRQRSVVRLFRCRIVLRESRWKGQSAEQEDWSGRNKGGDQDRPRIPYPLVLGGLG
jgi:hypothetical protein